MSVPTLVETSRQGYRRIFLTSGSKYISVLSPSEIKQKTPRYYIPPRVPDPHAPEKYSWHTFKKRRFLRLGCFPNPPHGGEDAGFPDPRIVNSSEVAPLAVSAAQGGADGLTTNWEFWRQLCEKLRTCRDVVKAGDLVAILDALVAVDYRDTDLMKVLTRELLDDLFKLTPTELAVVANAYGHFNCESRPLFRAITSQVFILVQRGYNPEVLDLRSGAVLLGALARFQPVPGARELASCLLDHTATVLVVGKEEEWEFKDAVGILSSSIRLGATGSHDKAAASALLKVLTSKIDRDLVKLKEAKDLEALKGANVKGTSPDGKKKTIFDDPDRVAVTDDMRRAQGLPTKGDNPEEIAKLKEEEEEMIGTTDLSGASPDMYTIALTYQAVASMGVTPPIDQRDSMAAECLRFIEDEFDNFQKVAQAFRTGPVVLPSVMLPKSGPRQLRITQRELKKLVLRRERRARRNEISFGNEEDESIEEPSAVKTQEEEDEEILFGNKDRELETEGTAGGRKAKRVGLPMGYGKVMKKAKRRRLPRSERQRPTLQDLQQRNQLASMIGIALSGLRDMYVKIAMKDLSDAEVAEAFGKKNFFKMQKKHEVDIPAKEAALLEKCAQVLSLGGAQGLSIWQLLNVLELFVMSQRHKAIPLLCEEIVRKFGSGDQSETARRAIRALRASGIPEEEWKELKQCAVAFT